MRLTIVGLFLFLAGCGPDFDPPSELHSLRVLGVQKDVPYAQPNDTVNLQMLWEDASVEVLAGTSTRAIEVSWSQPCFNPEGDLYYLCFKDPSVFAKRTFGDTMQFKMTSDVISSRTAPSQARNAPYGIAYVFFAVCAGHVIALPQTADSAFPIGCEDDNHNLLGSDDFVAGYTSVYSFASFSNKNPVISGFSFNGKPLDPTRFCVDDACRAVAGSTVPPTTVPCDAATDPLCLPTCAADGDKSCPGYSVKPTLVQADNQELDSVSAQLVGRDVTEQMWINYYTDGGSFKSPVRLLNDATTGWNDSYDAEFYAPKATGPSRIWAVVHDNRGGASWAGITVNLQ